MKGIFNALKKTSFTNSSSSISLNSSSTPTTFSNDHAFGTSTLTTAPNNQINSSSSSQTQPNASPKVSPLASPSSVTASLSSQYSSNASAPPVSNTIPSQIASIDRKYVRNVVDEWTNWSSSIFDHNKQVTQLIEHFLSSFDGWQSRDVPSELMKCESILRTISIETATSQREYEPVLSVSQEKVKKMIETTKGAIEKGKERAIAQRNYMISSEQFLQKERARLNDELQTEWKRNQDIFRQNQADLYAKFNVNPKPSLLLESSQPIEGSPVLNATSVDLVGTSSPPESIKVDSENPPLAIDESTNLEPEPSSATGASVDVSSSEEPISSETEPEPETTVSESNEPATANVATPETASDSSNTDVDSRIESTEESSSTSEPPQQD